MTLHRLLLAILLISPSPLLGMGKKIEENRISFHVQGSKNEGPQRVFPQVVKGQQRFFRKVPEVSTKYFSAYRPFPADDGSFGLTLQLNPVGTQRLFAVTTSQQQKWLLALFNGRSVDAVIINAPVKDGQLVIWQGITLDEVRRLGLQLPLIGESQKDWKIRAKAVRKALKEELKKRKK